MISPVLLLPDSIYVYNRRKATSKRALIDALHKNFHQAQLHLLDLRPCDKEWYKKQRDNLLKGTPSSSFKSVSIRSIPPTPSSFSLPSVGYAQEQGLELSMQDRTTMGEICFPLGQKTARVVYAIILDGHKGAECAQFLENRIPLYLKKRLEKIPHLEEDRVDVTIFNTLKLLGPKCNKLYQQHRGRREITSPATSTALVCLLYRRTLYTANIGDSRAMFVSANKTDVLSEDADLGHPKYQRGVQKRGGRVVQDATGKRFVQHPRNQDSPTIARALGYSEAHSGINPRATITKKTCTEKGHLILASKGLWSSLSCGQAAAWVRNTLEEKPQQSAQNLASSLVRLASRDRSIYNLSVLVIEFSPLSSRAALPPTSTFKFFKS